MSRRDRACWLDTEGCIPTSIRSRGSLSTEITIVQSERASLSDYAAGSKRDELFAMFLVTTPPGGYESAESAMLTGRSGPLGSSSGLKAHEGNQTFLFVGSISMESET